jgi:Tol biopolymer transport system component
MRKRLMTVLLALLGAFALADLLAAVYATRTESGVAKGIVFQAKVHGAYQLFTIDPDGTHLRQITELATPTVELPAWSPDGTTIIFDSSYGRRNRSIGVFTVKPNGTDLRRVPLRVGALSGAPSFSPSGRLITVDWDADAANGIDLARADGSKVRRLVASNDGQVIDGHSTWSPTGTWIAFTELRGNAQAAIVKVRFNGTGRTELTPWSLDSSNAAWSPNGRRLAFNSNNTVVPGVSSNIYTVRANGAGLRQLTHYEGGALNAYMGDWSPDGGQIVFHLRGPHVDQLFIMDADGRHARPLTHLPSGSDPRFAAWSPAG